MSARQRTIGFHFCEAAKLCNMSPSGLRYHVGRGHVPGPQTRHGERRYYTPGETLALRESLECESLWRQWIRSCGRHHEPLTLPDWPANAIVDSATRGRDGVARLAG